MYPPIKIAISAAGYTAVELPTGYGAKDVSLWTEDGSAYYYNPVTNNDTLAILVTTDGTNCFALSFEVNRTPEGGTIGYVKGTTTTNLVGLITRPK